MNRRLSTAIGVLFFIQASLFAAEPKEPEEKQERLFVTFQAGAAASRWTPGLNAQGEPLVRYRTEGLAFYEGKIILGYGESEIISFSHERPFSLSSSRQRDMLAARDSEGAGLEKYTGGIDLRPLLGHLFPVLEEHPFLYALLSVQFFHSRAVFHGTAEAQRTFFYVPQDARVDLNALTISGAKKLNAGEQLSFRTSFEEQEITIPLMIWPRYSLRGGYYDLAWKRPSANNSQYLITDGTGSYPILYDTTYLTKGVVMAIRNERPTHRGFNLDAGIRFGASNKIKAAIERRLDENQSLSFVSFTGDAWYNWYLREENRGLFFTLGGNFDVRRWWLETKDAAGNKIRDDLIDSEKLFGGYAKVGWRF